MIEGYERYKTQVESGLHRFLPDETMVPSSVHRAMRYSACDGGKRLRGVCCLMTHALFGGSPDDALPMACALEMIHAYSLIHDDLPCMDDDDLRRGKPTNHKVFGEAVALLAGNSLLTHAIETVLRHTPKTLDSKWIIKALEELVYASGTCGMLGGQVMDLEAEGEPINLEHLQEIHRRKTGALILASLRTGAILAGADETALETLTDYGESLGLVFQIVDDLLDVTGTTEQLGKPVGSDEKNAKATYPALCGIEASRRMADDELAKAIKALEGFGERANNLRQLAEYVVYRDN